MSLYINNTAHKLAAQYLSSAGLNEPVSEPGSVPRGELDGFVRLFAYVTGIILSKPRL